MSRPHTDPAANPTTRRVDRAREWRSMLLAVVSALLLFETATGLAIKYLSFSIATQGMVLVHTVGGLIFLLPYAVYQWRHWRNYRRVQMNHLKVTGYLAMVATQVASVSGVVLTVQAAFGTRISYAWDTLHVVSTWALVASVLPHVVLIPLRDRRVDKDRIGAVLGAQRRYGVALVVVTLVLTLPTVAWISMSRPEPWHNEFPADYSWSFGKDRPFAPSLATTSTGGAYDPRSLSGSRRCGDAGCHTEIVAEWEVSAHRWSALDPAFQSIQGEMAKQNGPESTRYCAGCHDPISLFSGDKTLLSERLTNQQGLEEGVSCLSCHAVRTTDVKGNANYEMSQPPRYLYELSDDPSERWLGNFLIRAYPWKHKETLSKSLFKTADYCAACHKQFIDKEINQVGWVQLQNQYDNWKASKWNHGDDATKTIECRECHMPLTDSLDPASGDLADYNRTPDDGKHRSHRFLASNTFIPAILQIPGWEEQVDLTEKWLRGEIPIPEIADKWAEGPAVGLEIVAADTAVPGEELPVRVIITSNKVGHDFPTGPLDIIQAWIDLEVIDADGRTVWRSGEVDEDHFIEPGAFMFKAEPVDRYGNLIDRHNLWEMVGVRYKRAIFPGFSDTASYVVPCPSSSGGDASEPLEESSFQVPLTAAKDGALTIRATLQYRKIDQYLLNFIYGEDTELTTPITAMATTSKTVTLAAEPAGDVTPTSHRR